jgi:hypothetical protein
VKIRVPRVTKTHLRFRFPFLFPGWDAQAQGRTLTGIFISWSKGKRP